MQAERLRYRGTKLAATAGHTAGGCGRQHTSGYAKSMLLRATLHSLESSGYSLTSCATASAACCAACRPTRMLSSAACVSELTSC